MGAHPPIHNPTTLQVPRGSPKLLEEPCASSERLTEMGLSSPGGEVVSQRVVGTAGKTSCLRLIRWDLPHCPCGHDGMGGCDWEEVAFRITRSGEGFKGQDQHLESHLEVTGSQRNVWGRCDTCHPRGTCKCSVVLHLLKFPDTLQGKPHVQSAGVIHSGGD